MRVGVLFGMIAVWGCQAPPVAPELPARLPEMEARQKALEEKVGVLEEAVKTQKKTAASLQAELDALAIEMTSPPPKVMADPPPASLKAGGSGGKHAYTLKCPPGFGVTSIAGKHGAVLDSVEVFCVSPDPMHSPWKSERAGGAGGTRDYSLSCLEGYRPTGLKVRAGAVIDAISLMCTKGPLSWASPMSGGSGGTEVELKCGKDEEILGIKGKHGAVLDSVELICGALEEPEPLPLSIEIMDAGKVYAVKRAEVKALLDEPKKLGSLPRLSPVYDQGKLEGFRVTGLRPGSVWSALGLRNGDVVESVGGEPVESLEIAKHLAADTVKVVVKRKGQPVELTFHVKQ